MADTYAERAGRSKPRREPHREPREKNEDQEPRKKKGTHNPRLRILYDEAEKQVRIWRSCGQYDWANSWESHANALRRCLDSGSNAWHKFSPPSNDHFRSDQVKQYRRPAMYQGVSGLATSIAVPQEYYCSDDESGELELDQV